MHSTCTSWQRMLREHHPPCSPPATDRSAKSSGHRGRGTSLNSGLETTGGMLTQGLESVDERRGCRSPASALPSRAMAGFWSFSNNSES